MEAIETTLEMGMAQAEAAVRQALSRQGFGVLTEIDVAAILQAKLGVSRSGLKILGACNPNLAHRVLELEPSAALLLPCNVVLADLGAGRTRVAIVDPRRLLEASGARGVEVQEAGAEAAASLEKVVADLGG